MRSLYETPAKCRVKVFMGDLGGVAHSVAGTGVAWWFATAQSSEVKGTCSRSIIE